MTTESPSGRPRTRVVRDTMGELEIPAEAYYGAQTARAMRNFPVSGQPARWEIFQAMLMIKKAAALTHGELGLLDRRVSTAIAAACDDLLNGAHRDQFVVDVFQAGAGTSLNTVSYTHLTLPTIYSV